MLRVVLIVAVLASITQDVQGVYSGQDQRTAVFLGKPGKVSTFQKITITAVSSTELQTSLDGGCVLVFRRYNDAVYLLQTKRCKLDGFDATFTQGFLKPITSHVIEITWDGTFTHSGITGTLHSEFRGTRVED